MPINYELQNAAIAIDAPAEAILACLANRRDTAIEEERNAPDLDSYFNPERDFDQLEAARAWWPKQNVPNNMLWSSSFFVALSSYCPLVASLASPNLLTSLGAMAQRVQQHLLANGGDAERPNEDRAERMRRLNRERVAAYRERQRSEGLDGERSAVVQAWERVQVLRRKRKETVAEHDAIVRQAYEHMTMLSEQRRLATVEWDRLVAEAEEEHRQIKSGVVASLAPCSGNPDPCSGVPVVVSDAN